MKKTLLLTSLFLYSVICTADADGDYKNEFRKNYYQSCNKEMTSGSDKVESKLAIKICSCMADKTVRSLSVPELKKYDKNPSAYENLVTKLFSQCLI